MKLKAAENIFESQIVGIFWSKVIGLNFITIRRDKFGKYFASTRVWDVLRFFILLIFNFSVAADNWNIPSDTNSNRSFLAEFLITMNGRVAVSGSCIELIQIFIFRHEFFNVLENIQWIDEKV